MDISQYHLFPQLRVIHLQLHTENQLRTIITRWMHMYGDKPIWCWTCTWRRHHMETFSALLALWGGIHRWPFFSMMRAWTNDWANSPDDDMALIVKSLSWHYIDVIMTTMASQITSLAVVYSTVYSDADQRKYQSSASLAFVWGIHRDRWIPRTKGQLRGKCFHLMTSSWYKRDPNSYRKFLKVLKSSAAVWS